MTKKILKRASKIKSKKGKLIVLYKYSNNKTEKAMQYARGPVKLFN